MLPVASGPIPAPAPAGAGSFSFHSGHFDDQPKRRPQGGHAMNILDLLLPREVEFFRMMNQQADMLVACATSFDEFVADIHKMSEYEVANALQKIREIESAGDEIERQIVQKLHTAFITPIDREDIHAIVTGVDNAIDSLNGTARKIEIYGFRQL